MTQPAPEPAPAHPAVKPKKPFWKRWWVWVLGIIIVIIVASSIGGYEEEKGGGPKATSPTQGSSPAASAATAKGSLPGIGQEVRDGKFAFVVNSVDRSKTEGDPSNPYMTETAQGEYLNVRMTVTNTGDKAQTFDASNQKLLAGGKQFKADSNAALWAGATYVSINPGNSKNFVSFDVPVGTPAGVVELHDSAFSTGAKVQLP